MTHYSDLQALADMTAAISNDLCCHLQSLSDYKFLFPKLFPDSCRAVVVVVVAAAGGGGIVVVGVVVVVVVVVVGVGKGVGVGVGV